MSIIPSQQAEADYEKLIKSINDAPPEKYHFADDALEVRDRVIDYLHKLENGRWVSRLR